jgi:hypothetical protein
MKHNVRLKVKRENSSYSLRHKRFFYFEENDLAYEIPVWPGDEEAANALNALRASADKKTLDRYGLTDEVIS